MRRSKVPRSTTDQRLLDTRDSGEWVHTDPWRVMRITSEFVEGFGALAKLGPASLRFRILIAFRDAICQNLCAPMACLTGKCAGPGENASSLRHWRADWPCVSAAAVPATAVLLRPFP